MATLVNRITASFIGVYGVLAVPVPVISIPAPFPGTLFVPADNLPHPAVFLLHGLESGSAPDRVREARAIAAQGYAAYAFCWFGCDSAGVPATPQNIDLGKSYEAFRWLRSSRFVRKRPTAIYGVGRGAEQALVLTVFLAKHPEYSTPNAVIAHAPSDHLQPVQPGTSPAWNWEGGLESLEPGSAILFNRYSGGVLISHGAEDQQQGVASSQSLEKQLREAGSAVRTYVHDRDPSHPPSLVGPSTSPARAEFHYFEGEGAVFDPTMDSVRMNGVIEFLQREFGGGSEI